MQLMSTDARGSMLSTLTPEQTRHCDAVRAAVHRALAVGGGWLAFEDYLRIVLYAPGLGYYSAGSVKFGADGDFVTAPELSVLFARCLARQCAEVLQAVDGDTLLELGAGSGRMAADVLATLAALGQLPEHYYILEVSAELRERQRATLATLPAPLAGRVAWLDTLPRRPIAGVVLANEVADALPFRRFAIHSGALWERGIAASAEGALIEADRAASSALVQELERLVPHLAPHLAPQWPVDYVSEFCPLQGPWIAALGDALARGAILVTDYGLGRREYYDPRRDRGTMRCHFRHRAHEDALRYPGLQDITAWVDFTRLAESALDARLEVSGYCTQAAFLLGTGIEAELAAAAGAQARARLASEARQLLLPGEMGEHFKALALTRGLQAPLQGFRHQDLRHAL